VAYGLEIRLEDAQLAGIEADVKAGCSMTRLLQLTEFCFETIKYWSGFADDFRSRMPKCSANI